MVRAFENTLYDALSERDYIIESKMGRS